jgi:hypothetical protein
MSQFLKSKLLEYITRRILYNCGFSSVRSDTLYIYDRPPLQMINGKGAAHDADVLMNPPIQMPFTYPTRIIFECKAYARGYKVGLDIVRNSLGLRNDINDFEIITEQFLLDRQNNRRAELAISDRKRHYYQVGVSTLFDFSKPALEFASNNKIPLLSISELFSRSGLAEAIDGIPPNINTILGQEGYNAIIAELSKKEISEMNFDVFVQYNNEYITRCIRLIDSEVGKVYVGVLESGEIIFVRFGGSSDQIDILQDNQQNNLLARIHWDNPERERWWFQFNESDAPYYFYLPREIVKVWKEYNDVRGGALAIKEEMFARFFIFNKTANDLAFPFKLVRLDMEWLTELVNRLPRE